MAENWRSRSHRELYESVHLGNDPGQVGTLADEWISMGHEISEHSRRMGERIRATESGWQGSGAEAARESILELVRWTDGVARTADDIGSGLGSQGQIMATTRDRMPEPVEFDWQAMLTEGFATGGLAGFARAADDVRAKSEQANAAHEEAVALMTSMEESSTAVRLATPEFTPPVTSLGAEVEATEQKPVEGQRVLPRQSTDAATGQVVDGQIFDGQIVGSPATEPEQRATPWSRAVPPLSPTKPVGAVPASGPVADGQVPGGPPTTSLSPMPDGVTGQEADGSGTRPQGTPPPLTVPGGTGGGPPGQYGPGGLTTPQGTPPPALDQLRSPAPGPGTYGGPGNTTPQGTPHFTVPSGTRTPPRGRDGVRRNPVTPSTMPHLPGPDGAGYGPNYGRPDSGDRRGGGNNRPGTSNPYPTPTPRFTGPETPPAGGTGTAGGGGGGGQGMPRLGGGGAGGGAGGGFGPAGSQAEFGPRGSGAVTGSGPVGGRSVPETGITGRGSGGAPGHAGGAPMGPMGAGAGARGQGDEDKERRSAPYIQGEDIFPVPGEELPPPVIGERKQRKQDNS